MSIAGRLWKYVFPPVNVKFSVFSVVLGFVSAILFGYCGKGVLWGSWAPPWLVFVVVAATDFVVEGVWQHGWDILNDRGGMSGFREDPSDPTVARIARSMVRSCVPLGVAVVAFLIASGRIAAAIVGLVASYLAWLYSKRRNECIPLIAVALAVCGGWFSATNVPGPQLLTAALIGGLTSRLSLAFYRYDDYVGINCPPDFGNPIDILVYYRNLFWIILWIPMLVACMLMYLFLPWWVPFSVTLICIAEIAYRRRFVCHESSH